MSQKRASAQTHQRLPALPLEELQGLPEMAAAGTAAGFSKKTTRTEIKAVCKISTTILWIIAGKILPPGIKIVTGADRSKTKIP